jgi:cobalt-zinc-cadmium efflux system protein
VTNSAEESCGHDMCEPPRFSGRREGRLGRLGQVGRLRGALAANLALVGALVGVGLRARSIGVFAEGVDYLADAGAIGLSLFAVHLSRPAGGRGQRPAGGRGPRPAGGRGPAAGNLRAATVAAAVNAGWLLAACFVVVAEAADRLAGGVDEVRGLPVLVVSGVAAVAMTAVALVLGGAGEDEGGEECSAGSAASRGSEASDGGNPMVLNLRAVLLDTIADAAGAAGVAVAGGVIYAVHGLYWLDPAVALAIATVVGYHAVRLSVDVRGSLRSPPASSPPADALQAKP